MAPRYSLRRAKEDDIHAMEVLNELAFGDNIVVQAIFPPRLRKNGAQDVWDWREQQMRKGFNNPQNHFVVVVQEPETEGSEEVVVGTAEWRSPAPKSAQLSKEDEEKKRAEQLAKMPDFMDKERVMEMMQRLPVESARVLGEGADKPMWGLQLVAVHPEHQRKGIGRMLLDWGLAAADEAGQDVYFISTAAGKRLYESAGLELLGEVDIFGDRQYQFARRVVS